MLSRFFEQNFLEMNINYYKMQQSATTEPFKYLSTSPFLILLLYGNKHYESGIHMIKL